MMALRQGLLAQLAQRWPWVGVVAGIFPVIRSMLTDETMRSDQGEVGRPIVVCLLLMTPHKQMTYVTADLADPLDEGDLRRIAYLWSQLGREACYKLLDAMVVQNMGSEPDCDTDEPGPCPACGAPWQRESTSVDGPKVQP